MHQIFAFVKRIKRIFSEYSVNIQKIVKIRIQKYRNPHSNKLERQPLSASPDEAELAVLKRRYFRVGNIRLKTVSLFVSLLPLNCSFGLITPPWVFNIKPSNIK